MQPIKKTILVSVFSFIFIFAVTAILINPLLIDNSKVKTFMAKKLNYTDSEISASNFTVKSIISDGNLTIIKLLQDGKPKTLIVSNKKALEKLI